LRNKHNPSISGAVDKRILYYIGLILFAAILAFYIGNKIGTEENNDLIEIGLFIIVSLLLAISRKWLVLTMVVSAFGFIMAPINFKVGPAEMALTFIACFAVANFWRPGFFGIPKELENFKFYTVCFFVLFIYLIIHSVYNITFPNNMENIAWTNLSKTIVATLIGFTVPWVAIGLARYSQITKNPYILLGSILIFGLLTNIIIRAYGTFVLGIGISENTDILSVDQASSNVLDIPGIHLYENMFQLRVIVPFALLFGVAVLVSKSELAKEWQARLSGISLIFLGFIGAALSGGRSTLIAPLIYCALYLMNRRKSYLILLLSFIVLLIALLGRTLYQVNPNYVPLEVQRSLALLPFMDMQEAKDSIDSSSDWRYGLFLMSLDDWEQSYRTIMFGRSIYAYTVTDDEQIKRDPFYGEQFVSMRRGATHNLVTDLLVPYGAVGFLLYFITLFVLLRSIYALRKRAYNNPTINDFSLMALVMIIVSTLSSIIGGQFLSLECGIVVAMLCLIARNELVFPIAPQTYPLRIRR